MLAEHLAQKKTIKKKSSSGQTALPCCAVAHRALEFRKESHLLGGHLGCRECDRLWADYISATRRHLGLKGKFQLALTNGDRAILSALSAESQAAARSCIEARERLMEHGASVHSSLAAKMPRLE